MRFQWSVSLFLLVLLLCGAAGCSSKEEKQAAYLQRADRFYELKQYDKARIEYLNLLRLDPLNPKAMRRLGWIHFDRAEFQQAAVYLVQLDRVAPGDVEVMLRLGRICVDTGEYKRAREQALFILGKNPLEADALFILVEAATEPGAVKQAKDLIEKAQGKLDDKAAYHLAVGRLRQRENDLAAAETAFKKAVSLDAQSAAAHDALARLCWQRGDRDRADQSFKTACGLVPMGSMVRIRYADFKAKTGAMAEAKGMLEEIARQAGEPQMALEYLAQIAFVERRYPDCLKLIDRVLAMDPKSVNSRLLRGRVRLALGEAAKAVETLEPLSAENPSNALIQYELALAWVAVRDTDKAADRLSRALSINPDYGEAILAMADLDIQRGRSSAAIGPLQRMLATQPNNTRAQMLLANAHRARGEFNQALKLYQQLESTRSNDLQVVLFKGVVLRQQGKKPEARRAFEKVLQLDPESVAALTQLVEMDVADQAFDAAVQRVQGEIQRRPKEAGLKLLLAKVYLAQEDVDQVEAVLLGIIQADPGYVGAYVMLAQAYVGLNKHQQALEKLNQILARKPNDVPSLMLLGMLQETRKDYRAAVDAYERLFKVQPRFGPALNNLAYLYAEHLGNTTRAYELAQEARRILPQSPVVADTVGWVLWHRGDYGLALASLREAAAKMSEVPEVLYHLGMAHYMMGNDDAARNALKGALELAGEFPSRDNAKRHLQVLETDVSNFDQAVLKSLDATLKQDPKDLVALLRIGALHELRGNHDQARTAYEQALRLNPRAVRPNLLLARLYAERLGDTAKALELAKTARNLAPSDPETAFLLGKLAFRTGSHSWALSLLQECDQARPNQPEIQYALAWAQYGVGAVSDAEQTMQRSLQSTNRSIPGGDAKGFLTFVGLLKNPADARQAEPQVAQVLSANSNYVPALMVSALIREQQGEFTEAGKLYERVLGIYPGFIPAMKPLAHLYAQPLQDPDKAMVLARRLRDAQPQDPDVAKLLGKMVYQNRDYPYALQLLKESLGRKPNDAELHYLVGMAHYQLKQSAESKQALQQALTLDGQAAFAPEARRVLAELH